MCVKIDDERLSIGTIKMQVYVAVEKIKKVKKYAFSDIRRYFQNLLDY